MFKPNSKKRQLLRIANKLAISNLSLRSQVSEMTAAIDHALPHGYRLADPANEGRIRYRAPLTPFVSSVIAIRDTHDYRREGGGGCLPT